MSHTLYQSCATQFDGATDAVLQCVTDALQAEAHAATLNTNAWLLTLTGALVFFMQAGFAMLCAGCVRRKNVQNTMLKNLLDACGAALAWYATGYAFAFGESGSGDTSFIGAGSFLQIDSADAPFWFFQYAASATAVTIVAGTLAERCQMIAYLLYSLFLTGFVYPISARALWSSHGFLSPKNADPFGGIGAIDFAGSGVVHITGGMVALVAAIVLGPRKGRFYDSKGVPHAVAKEFPGHSIALQLMGTMVLWFTCMCPKAPVRLNDSFRAHSLFLYRHFISQGTVSTQDQHYCWALRIRAPSQLWSPSTTLFPLLLVALRLCLPIYTWKSVDLATCLLVLPWP